MAHPANAAYVSGDGKVSFDQWGRKLDSLGNVAWGDRQTVQGAGGRPIERPQPQQQQPAQQQGYNPLSGGSANTGVPARTGSAMAPAPAPAGQRPIPPGVLAPGGIDPATGRKVQTYYNTVMSPAGDDYALRNPQPQLPTQQWRPAGQGPLTQRPPSPSAGDVGMPGGLMTQRAYDPLAYGQTGQRWRPLPTDMVYQGQRYTYSDPNALSSQLPFSGGSNPDIFDPYGYTQPYNPFSVERVTPPPPTRSSGMTGQPPPYWMVP